MTKMERILEPPKVSESGRTNRTNLVMAYMRDGIQNNDRLVNMISHIKTKLGSDAEKIVVEEALYAKSVEDGQNLLMHAAAHGRKRLFVALTKIISERGKTLDYLVLVRQLRELDKDGAPLLFHAAKSNSLRCLKTVLDILKKNLGVGGLDEQLHAIDHKGRNVLMFAVRSPAFDVYSKIVQELEDNSYPKRPPSLAFDRRDAIGRSLLHYAAESDCPRILQKVVHQANKGSLFISPDYEGRTPVMSFLSKSDRINKSRLRQSGSLFRSSSDGPVQKWKVKIAQRMKEREGNLDMILNKMNANEQLESLTQPPTANSAGRESRLNRWGLPKDELTALMYAAHGGRLAFDLAVKKIKKLGEETSSDGRFSRLMSSDFLDVALGVGSSADKQDLRKGLLLEEAAMGGDLNVFRYVVSAIDPFEMGALSGDRTNLPAYEDDQSGNEQFDNSSNNGGGLLRALESIYERGNSLFTSAISSRNIRMVKQVARLIDHHYGNDSKKGLADGGQMPKILCYDQDAALQPAAQKQAGAIVGDEQIWDHLRGNKGNISSLSCAASTPRTAKENGQGLFDAVLECLRKAALKRYADLRPEEMDSKAMEANDVNKLLRDELVVTREPRGRGKPSPVSPLGGAVLQNNAFLFERVYKEYEKCQGSWNRQQILDQLREETMHTRDIPEAHTIAKDGDIVVNVPAQMWHTVTEAFEKAYGDASWVRWRDYFSRTVQALAERGDLAQMRELVKEKFPLHNHIPVLLERIGDYEENVIETVILVVAHARNPFVAWAGVSRDIIKAEVNLPMYKIGLRRLRNRLDNLVIELLDRLPHTVRGVGRELHGNHEPAEPIMPHPSGDLTQQRKRDQIVGFLGFVVVRWMLEPSLTSSYLKGNRDNNPSEMLDPLQHALDRGSTCLAFVNSPLVLDYLHLKFWSSLPGWTSQNPFNDTIPTAFYAYVVRPSDKSWLQSGAGELLRFLQGWDKAGDVLAPVELASFPHSTLLSGLQFTLAGIIGNPVTFFEVASVRFMLELMSYILMLGLFCASASIQKSDEIPPQECIFYVFVLGLLWREFLEFKQLLPARPDVGEGIMLDRLERSRLFRICYLPRPKEHLIRRHHHVASAIHRYLFYDTWNILDTITIVVVAAAFVFRILALGEGWSAADETLATPGVASQNCLFMAQLCLSFSAPLLFSRVLFLSQIDSTLGPMTQVIWVMMSHLARFAIFLLVVMTSFALAFHTLFFTCEGVEPNLDDAFGTFWQSLLTVFESMLGSFDFDLLLAANECNRPHWAYEVSVWLLVGYMIIMTILLLNLLIAVMTTAHSAVDAHAEEEFQLSRAKLILQTSRGVAKGRLPAPFNLIGAVMGCLVDIPHAIRMLCYVMGLTKPLAVDTPKESAADDNPERPGHRSVDDESKHENISSPEYPSQPEDTAPAPSATAIEVATAPDSNTSNGGTTVRGTEMSSMPLDDESSRADTSHGVASGEKTGPIEPFTRSYLWHTIEGGGDRLIFAFTMGAAAIAMSAVLWIVSTPWIAWRILCWYFPAGTDESKGYTWDAASAVVKVLGWFLALPVALVYCCACGLLSVVLWLLGLCSIIYWVYWKFTVGQKGYLKRDRCSVMPGEEINEDWCTARKIAKARNYAQNSTDLEHFNVGPLLKMTTGMDVEQLALHIERRAKTEKLQDYVMSSLLRKTTESLDYLQDDFDINGITSGEQLASRSIIPNSVNGEKMTRARSV